jgi:hypothetical protein
MGEGCWVQGPARKGCLDRVGNYAWLPPDRDCCHSIRKNRKRFIGNAGNRLLFSDNTLIGLCT